MKIAIAADHAGWKDKVWLVGHLQALGHEVVDLGTDSEESCDYPDFAVKAARAVSEGTCNQGILVCGTGIGMAMAANKVRGIRAASCQSVEAAKFSRTHNNANVLCVGSRLSTPEQIREMVDAWLSYGFKGGRHERRIKKIDALDEGKTC